MRIVSLVMAVVFLGFLAVQFNDTDGWVWIMAYGACALLSLYAALKPVARVVSLTMAVIFTLWAVWLVPETTGAWWGGEVEREIGGLVICALWNLILYRWTASRT